VKENKKYETLALLNSAFWAILINILLNLADFVKLSTKNTQFVFAVDSAVQAPATVSDLR
jgi:hypothetical protein